MGRPHSDAGRDAGEGAADASEPHDGGLDADVDTESDASSDASACGDTSDDPNHCGDCSLQCVAPDDGFATCESGTCQEHRLTLTDSGAGPLHGGNGGGVFSDPQRCGSDEVMIGMSGTGDENILYGLGVHCARFTAENGANGYAVAVLPTTRAVELGGLIDPPPAKYDLNCTAGSVVTAVTGATWLWPGAATLSVRQLSLVCSRLSVAASGAVVLASQAETLTVGNQQTDSAEPFAEACDATSAVAGLSGRSGAYIDAVAVHCGQLKLEKRGGKTAARDN